MLARLSCHSTVITIVAIFYPFSQFCEINISLLSLQTLPNTAPNLFQRGVEYGKYDNDLGYCLGLNIRAAGWSHFRRGNQVDNLKIHG